MLLALGCGPQKWVNKGDSERASNHLNASIRSYERALKIDPSMAAALTGMAAAYLAREEPQRAVLPAQRATRAGDVHARALLAKALILTGRAKDARKTIEEGLSSSPSNDAWLLLHVESILAAGDVAGAARAADALANIETPEALSLRAWVLSRADRDEEAAAVAAQLAKAAPEDPRYQSEAAAIFHASGQTDRRDAAKDKARSYLPSNPSDFLREANFHLKGGDTEGAIRRLSWARAVYPFNSEVARLLGLNYAERAQWDRAARELTAALSMPPFAKKRAVNSVRVAYTGDIRRENMRRTAVVEIATTLGEAHAQLGQRRLAAEAWQQAVERNPSATADDYVAVAKAWELAGDVDRMGAVARAVSEMAPRSAEAQHAMSRALAASGNLDAAITYGRRAWDLAPRSVSIAVYLGDLFERRGEPAQARAIYTSTLKHSPGDTRLLLGLQRVGR